METLTAKTKEKKVFMETFGCQSNVLESDHVTGLLLKNDFSMTQSIEEADVILFNTCSIRRPRRTQGFFPPGPTGRLETRQGRPGHRRPGLYGYQL